MAYSLKQKIKTYGLRKIILFCFLGIQYYIKRFFKGSYSQCDEDLEIDRLLYHKKKGFYIDIGANDPNYFNNTKRFYKRGWRGINIEPDKENISKFNKSRKGDTNLNIGIASKSGKLVLYKFIPDTLSTFDKKTADSYVKQGFTLEERRTVKVEPLGKILKQYCRDVTIDFITIDTEGFDLEVLESNDWDRFTPTIVCTESVKHIITSEDKKLDNSPHDFLISRGYRKVYTNGINDLYKFQGLLR